MKVPFLILICFLIIGCSNNQKDLVLGTWVRCGEDGSYIEYKITNTYFLLINSKSDHIWIFKNKIEKNSIIISDLEKKYPPLINPDTLIVESLSVQKILLRSTYTGDHIELKKANFDFEPIDSSNFKNWRKNIQIQFHKREKSKNCKDLRTQSEKEIQIIDIDSLETENNPIIIIDKKTGITDTIQL